MSRRAAAIAACSLPLLCCWPSPTRAQSSESDVPSPQPSQSATPSPPPSGTQPAGPRRAKPIPRPVLKTPPSEQFAAVPPPIVEPVTTVQWDPRWRTAGLWDAVIVGTGAIVIIGDNVLESGASEADWSRPILWDNSVRDALRIRVAGGRDTAATISDVMMMGSLIHNILFDNLVVAWAIHGEPKLASQMSMMNAEAYAIAMSLTSIVKNVTSRARPLVQECEADPTYSVDCETVNRNRSFFSGHASTTAVGAGLLCAHHLNVPLYDNGLLDVGTCVMGIGLTMATGALRIASDNHWATDVTTGHLVGFASGFLVPTFLYYTGDEEPGSEASSTHALVLPAAGPNHIGLQLVGGFH